MASPSFVASINRTLGTSIFMVVPSMPAIAVVALPAPIFPISLRTSIYIELTLSKENSLIVFTLLFVKTYIVRLLYLTIYCCKSVSVLI